MTGNAAVAARPVPRLRPGDRVRLVSPASTPGRAAVAECQRVLMELGLVVELGAHVFNRHGFLAGTDSARLADFNAALRDPGVAAIVATRGGKGAYRIAADLDFAAARRRPRLLIGFSEVTILQLALFRHCGQPAIHGAAWSSRFDPGAARSFVHAACNPQPVVINADPAEATSALTTAGTATGVLLGGNQELVATAAGWVLPDLRGAILLLEGYGLRLGQMDRHLTMLHKGGWLDGIAGVAVGQYTDCVADATTQGDWTVLDVLTDRLHALGVPVLGGLPLGHGQRPVAVPVGTTATINCEAGTLTVDPAVC